MSQKKPSPDKPGEGYPKTRMRTPFTADVPGEYDQEAEWVPNLTSYPDVSDEECPARDPLAFLPGSKGRNSG